MNLLPSAARSMDPRGDSEVIVAQAFPDMLSCGLVVSGKGWGCGRTFEEYHQERVSPNSSPFVKGVPLLRV